ncbi:MAG: tRNA uridine-5-carboxymethylaminomethyl(34) synthesis GTPase MnmE [Chitinophagales bacterium]|nr:tRNA uridine-5-carboxymethylaminomethyl(34) synthesis GTPase MnmE [Chitinophagales bacterium]
MIFSDTIVAPATAAGIGALAVIRVSGTDALTITSAVFKGKDLTLAPSHTVHYGFITTQDKTELIDEVMVAVFKAPKSFTSENTTEISCHGSPLVVNKIVEALIAAGARLAKPGEFSLRAFINGRINLAQAEAVADIIASENDMQHKVALQQMRGGFANELQILRQQLIDYTALIELELDFGEEDVEFAKREQLIAFIDNFSAHITELIHSFKAGNAIKEGIPIAIIGKPNAGKSTLLNALLNEERAIVSDIAGTTRDTIEDVMHYKGISFRFIDTAGIRQTSDTIESIGVEKALQKARNASIVIYLFEIATTTAAELLQQIEALEISNATIIPVANKIDKVNWKATAPFTYIPNIKFIAAATKFNIEDLKESLHQHAVGNTPLASGSAVVTNIRHYEALIKANRALQKAQDGLMNKLSGELVAFDLREALEHLGSITGEVSNEDVLSSIFSRFCIGK